MKNYHDSTERDKFQTSMEWCCIFYNDIKYLIGGLEKLTYLDKLDENEKLLIVSLISTMLRTADEKLDIHFNKSLVSYRF